MARSQKPPQDADSDADCGMDLGDSRELVLFCTICEEPIGFDALASGGKQQHRECYIAARFVDQCMIRDGNKDALRQYKKEHPTEYRYKCMELRHNLRELGGSRFGKAHKEMLQTFFQEVKKFCRVANQKYTLYLGKRAWVQWQVRELGHTKEEGLLMWSAAKRNPATTRRMEDGQLKLECKGHTMVLEEEGFERSKGRRNESQPDDPEAISEAQANLEEAGFGSADDDMLEEAVARAHAHDDDVQDSPCPSKSPKFASAWPRRSRSRSRGTMASRSGKSNTPVTTRKRLNFKTAKDSAGCSRRTSKQAKHETQASSSSRSCSRSRSEPRRRAASPIRAHSVASRAGSVGSSHGSSSRKPDAATSERAASPSIVGSVGGGASSCARSGTGPAHNQLKLSIEEGKPVTTAAGLLKAKTMAGFGANVTSELEKPLGKLISELHLVQGCEGGEEQLEQYEALATRKKSGRSKCIVATVAQTHP